MSAASAQLRWVSASATHPGLVREVNEDAFLDRPDLGLWAVADGMGGHVAGHLASRLVVQALAGTSPNRQLGRTVANLRSCLCDANRRLRAEARQRGVPVIGSTVAVLAATGGHCASLWVGDSRVYRLRNGVLRRLSRDHSGMQELIDQGFPPGDVAKIRSLSNMLTRAVGADDTLQVDAQIDEIKVGDRFLLCTDGLTKEISESRIATLLGQVAINALPKTLVKEACKRGAPDNVTAVVAQLLPIEAGVTRLDGVSE